MIIQNKIVTLQLSLQTLSIMMKDITYFVFLIYFIAHHKLVYKYHYENELWLKIMIVFVPLVFSLILYLLPVKHKDDYDDDGKRNRKDWIIILAPIIAMIFDIILIYFV